jgi:H+/Cl- antiporter ClcA
LNLRRLWNQYLKVFAILTRSRVRYYSLAVILGAAFLTGGILRGPLGVTLMGVSLAGLLLLALPDWSRLWDDDDE